MDPRNGWVENHGSRSVQDKTIVERIMLRFRPIAPKPAAGDSGSGCTEEGGSKEVLGKARKKRKYVRVKQTRCNNKVEKKKEGVESENIFDFEVVQNQNESGSSINLDFKVEENIIPGGVKMDNRFGMDSGFSWGGGVVDRVDRTMEKVVESWMMVEGVSVNMDVWFGEGGGGGLGSSDMEKMKNLEMDSCPGLISDGFGRVQWVNLAYRKLVDPPKDGGGESVAEVVAWLVVKEKLPMGCQAFACTVRVVYPWNNNNSNNNNSNENNNKNNYKKKYVSHTMPCDVWRMDFGGFAWRLDSKAALSLGR